MASGSVVPNEELRALLLRFYRMWEERDLGGLAELFTTAGHLLIAGTDPDEWWSGPTGVDVVLTQVQELPRATIESSDLRAYSVGAVGWVADQPRFTFPDGGGFRGRLTATLVVERGHWRIVQFHLADPMPNAHPLTTSIDQVASRARRDRTDVEKASAPDGTVTVVFTDIESSTTLLDRLGDTEFVQLLGWHDRAVHEAVDQHGGFVVKSEGDGFMLAFPSASSALRACVVLRDRLGDGYRDIPVRVRMGVHVGEAIRHADDFYGRTVVIAARIGSLALGGEILTSGLVHALAQGLGTFTFGPPRTTALKGIDGTFELYPVLA